MKQYARHMKCHTWASNGILFQLLHVAFYRGFMLPTAQTILYTTVVNRHDQTVAQEPYEALLKTD
jgi:hypothetical protein